MFYVVVVLYNKNIYESQSIQHIMQLCAKDIKIIVLDNSTDDYVERNKLWGEQKGICYYSMGGNVGLSKAYNFALSLLKSKNENDLVIWFDDDTPVKKEYFEILRIKAMNKDYDVFTPIIYGQNGVIYSPNETGFLKGKYIKSPDEAVDTNKFNAINSCLAVRLKVYRNYLYDESLFMDCVDTKLFDDFRKMNVHFCVLPVKIYQNFFQHSKKLNVDKYWARFQIRIKDTATYSSKGKIKLKLAGIIRIYGWTFVYGLKLKSFSFFTKSFILGTKEILKSYKIGSRQV